MTAPDLTDPRAVLRAAAEHQARVGLCQGNYFASGDDNDPDAACCPLGAMRVVADVDTDRDVLAATVLMERHLGVPLLNDWVDEDGRTLGEVVGAMRGAAEVTP